MVKTLSNQPYRYMKLKQKSVFQNLQYIWSDRSGYVVFQGKSWIIHSEHTMKNLVLDGFYAIANKILGVYYIYDFVDS